MKARIAALAAGSLLAAAAAFVATHEGYVPEVYEDPVGIPTVCFGHTGPGVEPGKTYTRAECEGLLAQDLHIAFAAVETCIRVPLTDNAKVAFASLAYNAGRTALCRSTLARRANAGEPPWLYCPEFERWVYAKGKKLPGLVRRRKEERRLCES